MSHGYVPSRLARILFPMSPVDLNEMSELPDVKALQRQFLDAVAGLRPKLHRFCARMCRSALDGEDLVQDTLAQAFFQLPSLQDPNRLEPWMFRIAHRKCIDFLRVERRETVPYDEETDTRASEPDTESIGETVAPLLGRLPPMERAAVILKDLLQYRLEEIAEIVDSTVGAVKAALHRGREKLKALHETSAATELDPPQRALLEAFVDCFNRQDWNGLEKLIASDARLDVVDIVAGKKIDDSYRTNYVALPWQWRLSVARVDGELVVLHSKNVGGGWQPHSAIRLSWQDGKVVRIRDYVHVDYVLRDATLESV
jgi:RNA polymerase sigma-70 factor, ECF subfamily